MPFQGADNYLVLPYPGCRYAIPWAGRLLGFQPVNTVLTYIIPISFLYHLRITPTSSPYFLQVYKDRENMEQTRSRYGADTERV